MRNEKITHLVPNRVPRNFRTKLVSIWNGNNPHDTLVRLRARRSFEHVLGGPVDELGPAFLGTHASIVKVRFKFGNFVGARVSSSSTRDTVVARPEIVVLRATALVGG